MVGAAFLLIGLRLYFRRLLTIFVVGAAFLLIGLRLYRQWDRLATHHWEIHWTWLLLSFPVLAAWFLGRARLWQLAVNYQGQAIGFQPALRIWTLSELGRYLPGSVWHVVGRSFLAGESGVRGAAALLATLVELALVTLVACLGFLAAVLSSWGAHAGYAWLTLALVPVVLAGLHPSVLFSGINLALRKLGRPALTERLGYGQLLKMLGLAGLVWLGFSAALGLLTMGIWPVASGRLAPIAGFYAGAWVIGLIIIVSPGGLGVREEVLARFLAPSLGEAGGLVISLASRVWVTLAELVFALTIVALGIGREGGKDRNRAGPGGDPP